MHGTHLATQTFLDNDINKIKQNKYVAVIKAYDLWDNSKYEALFPGPIAWAYDLEALEIKKAYLWTVEYVVEFSPEEIKNSEGI